jgi:hypothetical protein
MNTGEYPLPVRSPDGLAALDIFYDDFNDIHFFVEDEDQENLYEVVLRKLFPTLRIAKVIPLGGKKAVLAHAKGSNARDEAPFGAYLLDKDFDDLLGACVVHEAVFYLDRYCIENYFLDPDAVVEIVVESQPKEKRRMIQQTLDVQTKLPALAESSRDLFMLFFCAQRFGLGIKNCGLAPERFCTHNQRWELDVDAVRAYADEVVRVASKTEHGPQLIEPLKHPEVANLRHADVNRVVSGKHICTMLFHFVKSKYNLGSISFESFVFRLAKNSSIVPLLGLARSIRSAAIAADPRYAVIVTTLE